MPVPHRLTSPAVWGWVLAAFLLGGCTAADASDTSAPLAAAASARPNLTPHPELSTYRSTRSHTQTAPPVRLRIPAIDVDTRLDSLGLNDDKSIQVPEDPDVAGWWKDGPRPGQVGPAVILGHVDSKTGPAAFYRLEQLEPGDEVLVDREDGTTARFEVTAEGTYEKAAFPSDRVYYPTLEPEVRLVTCKGPIDRGTGHYRDNLVVFAAQGT